MRSSYEKEVMKRLASLLGVLELALQLAEEQDEVESPAVLRLQIEQIEGIKSFERAKAVLQDLTDQAEELRDTIEDEGLRKALIEAEASLLALSAGDQGLDPEASRTSADEALKRAETRLRQQRDMGLRSARPGDQRSLF